MGKVPSPAVQARQRRLSMEVDRQVQDDWIDGATGAVILAVVAADTAAAAVTTGAEQRIGVSPGMLEMDMLPGSRIAEVTERSTADGQRLSEQAAATAGTAARNGADSTGRAVLTCRADSTCRAATARMSVAG